MTARRFTLINAVGDELALNSADTFGYNPSGLGASFDNGYIGANANFIATTHSLNQGRLAISVILGAESGDCYGLYNRLAEFLDKPPYVLLYSTPDGEAYSRDCALADIGKTEINEWNVLDQELELDFLTPWYKEVSLETGGRDPEYSTDGRGKIYAVPAAGAGRYVYPYVYGDYAGVGGGAVGALNGDNKSLYLGQSVGSPCKITVHAMGDPVDNPEWGVYKGSELVASDRYMIQIPPGYKLEVSSYPQDEHAYLVSPAGDLSSVYQSQDMTKTNFVTLPTGEVTVRFNISDPTVRISVVYREEKVLV
jgi:hypothetical protein